MLYAELHGKLSSEIGEAERREDLLTSTVFANALGGERVQERAACVRAGGSCFRARVRFHGGANQLDGLHGYAASFCIIGAFVKRSSCCTKFHSASVARGSTGTN